MQPIHLLTPETPDDNRLEALLRIAPLDYMVHRIMYTTLDGDRALATIIRDAFGHTTVRRVMPGRLDTSSDLRNWLEMSVYLDMAYPASEWMRDPDEEERYRRSDRNYIERWDVLS